MNRVLFYVVIENAVGISYYQQNRTAAEGEVSFEATCRSAILQEGIFLEASACTSVIAV